MFGRCVCCVGVLCWCIVLRVLCGCVELCVRVLCVLCVLCCVCSAGPPLRWTSLRSTPLRSTPLRRTPPPLDLPPPPLDPPPLDPSSAGPPSAGPPLRRTAPPPDRTKCRSFSPLPTHFLSFFPLGWSSRGIVVADRGHGPPKVCVQAPWGHFVNPGGLQAASDSHASGPPLFWPSLLRAPTL